MNIIFSLSMVDGIIGRLVSCMNLCMFARMYVYLYSGVPRNFRQRCVSSLSCPSFQRTHGDTALLKTNTVLNNLIKQSILKTTLCEIELPSCIYYQLAHLLFYLSTTLSLQTENTALQQILKLSRFILFSLPPSPSQL